MKRKILSVIIALVMCVNALPIAAVVEESPEQAQLRQQLYSMVDAGDYPNGLISFLTPQMGCVEGQDFIEFAVVRYGPTDTAASVKFKAIDISAHYGEDYYITVPRTFIDDRLEMDAGSVPILEFTAKQANDSELTLGDEPVTKDVSDEEDVFDDDESLEEVPENESEAPKEDPEVPEAEPDDAGIPDSTNPSGDGETFYGEDNLVYEGGAVESASGNVEALASARTALLGVPTDTTTWQGAEAEKAAAAEALLAQTRSYYDDMPGASYTLDFAPGENMRVLRFYVIDDLISESEEQVLFTLTDVQGSALDPNPTGYMNITDNEGAVSSVYVFEENTVYANEDDTYVTATLLRSEGIDRYDTVTVGTSALTAIPGIDYPAFEQKITFVPGQIRQTVRIPVLSTDRSEIRTFNLQTRGEMFTAAVTVVLPSTERWSDLPCLYDNYTVMPIAENDVLDPSDKTGHSFSTDTSYKGLEGSGAHKYRVYRWVKEVKSTASDSIGKFEYLTPASMGGIQKVKYTIEDIENGTPYTVVSDWGTDTYYHVGCQDRLGVISGTVFYSSDSVQTPAETDVTKELSNTDRTKKGFVLSTGAKDGNQNTDLKLTYMDVYVSPVEIALIDPPDEDTDGSVSAYTWNSQNVRGSSSTTYKMGRLGFAGDAENTTKIVYPDGDATGKISFVPVYEADITADIADKTYLWGYKIERKAGQLDGVNWYYVKGTDFNINDFMNDLMTDSVTHSTILHSTCGNTQTDGDVTYYRYDIQPVFKAKDATVKLSWDDTKLRSDKGAFVNGKPMNIGMLDTINYRLISATGTTELPSKYTGFVADASVNTDDTAVTYSLSISASRPIDSASTQFDKNLNFKLTLTSQDGSTVTRDVTIDTGDELSRLVGFVASKTFTFTQDELNIDNIVSASLSTSSLDQGVTLSGTFEKHMFGKTFQRTTFARTKVPTSKTNFTLRGDFKQVFSYTVVDSFPINISEPGKFDFSPTKPYTEITAIAGSASIDIRYDPASSSEGKNIGTVLHIGDDGKGDKVDPDKGLQIDDVKLNSLYTFNGVYNDEGDGGANQFRKEWKIQWKDWTGDSNRDGVITKEEQASLGSYGDKIDRTAVTGNAFQFVPIFFNSQIYYSFVRRDPAPDGGRVLTVKGSVSLQRGTVFNNLDSRGLTTSSTPVKGATVVVDGMSTTTDENGNFSFSSEYFRSGENYLAVISYNGLTYSVVMQVNAFKNIFLEEFKYFTPYDLKAYVKNGGNYSSIDLTNPIYPDNSDSMQKWTFKLSENVANISAEKVSLNLYDSQGNRLVSIPANYNPSNFTWEAEFNPANYDGTTSGTARALSAGSTMRISVVGSDDITYPEFEVGILFKRAISTITVLNTFKTPVNQLIEFIGTLDSQFDLGLSVALDKNLKDRAETSGERVLISFGINKEFEGQFSSGGEEEEEEGGGKPKKIANGDSGKVAQNTSNSNILDYLKEIAKGELTQGADPKKATEAVSNALKGSAAKTDGSVMDGYKLDMGIGLYLAMKVDKTSGDLYFDGLIVAAAMIGDVGYKFSMATPIGVTLTAGLDFGGNITGLVAVEPHNFAKIKFSGEGEIDVTKAGDLNSGLDVYGKLFVMPYVIVSAGADVSAYGFSAANVTVSGKAQFDMAFSTAGSGTGSVTMTCELALNVLGIFSKTWTLAKGTWQLFNYNPSVLSAAWDGDYRYDTVTSADVMNRSYLMNRTGWNGSGSGISAISGLYGGGILGNSDGFSREDTLRQGVYPYAYPLIKSIGDLDGDGVQEQLMVFLDTDTGDQYAQNSTRLYYSIFQNNIWTEPQEVDDPDDRLHDDSPNIADLGDRILVVWTSATQCITANANPIDVMNNRNIKGRFFYKDSRTWGPVTDITVSTAQDTTGDDKPTIIYCEDKMGGRYLMLTYVKSAHTASGDNGEDALVGDLLDPKSELAYRFYDFNTESWVSKYDGVTMQRLVNALGSYEAAENFEVNWYGQNFVDLSAGANTYASASTLGPDPVITDNEGVGFVDSKGHAIGLSAYIVDMDGNKSTVADRDIFLVYYDFTLNKVYKAIRITDDKVEQSYISALKSLDGAEIFFLSDGSIKELNVSYLWETLTDDGSGDKALVGEPLIYTAIAAMDENTPILEFVVDTDGQNDYIFWTETDISYVNGVEPNTEEASDSKNHLAERHIYGALRAMDDGVGSVLHDVNGNVKTYPAGIDYNTVPDINGQVGVVKAGDPMIAFTRTWGGPIQVTDEAGANFSDIDVTLLYDGGFRMVYLKSYSTLKDIQGEMVVAEDIQNRSLCTADFNVSFTSYDIELDPVTSLPAVGYPIPVTATVKNTGFCTDKNRLVAELVASVNGGEEEIVSSKPLDRISSGRADSVVFEWEVPEGLESVELTARLVSLNDAGTISRFYDESTVEYERKPIVGITVLSSGMTDMNQAEITVNLQNTGDAPASDQIIIASIADVHSMSQPYSLMPGEETTLTFKVTIPDNAFASAVQSDNSVIDTAKITITSGSAIAEAVLTRTVSAEDMAIAASISNVTLTDSNGKAINGAIIVERNELITLRLTADMTGDYDDSLLTLILVSEDGTIVCDGDSFIASGDGVITAYIVPKGSAALLTAGSIATDIDILHLISSEAIKTLTLNVAVKGGSERPLPPDTHGFPGYKHKITISDDSTHADIHIDPDNPNVAQTVTVTVKPDEGYEISLVTVTDSYGNVVPVVDKGNGTYTFIMPPADVILSVTSEEIIEIDHPTEGKVIKDAVETGDKSYDARVWIMPAILIPVALACIWHRKIRIKRNYR